MSNYVRKDALYRKAKEEGYSSRASYKLIELDKKYKLLRPGQRVLDLGCFPGGWLQVAAEKVGPDGRVVGIDLREVPNFPVPLAKGSCVPETIEGDLTDPASLDRLRELLPKADLVLSDLSPNLSGIALRDAARTAELVELAFSVAKAFMTRDGAFVAKAFPGNDVEEIIRRESRAFRRFDRTCLKSSRTTSNELYLIARGLSSP